MIVSSITSQTRFGVIALIAATALASNACAQRVVELKATAGKSLSTAGSIKGRDYVDYRIAVGAGQSLAVELTGRSSTAVFFNIMPPGSDWQALFLGSNEGSKFAKRMMPDDGKYTIRVYQMGAAASDGKKSTFTVKATVSGKALAAASWKGDVKIAGTRFHASTQTPCTLLSDSDHKFCDAFVVRRGNGTGTVEFRPKGLVRRVLFVNGAPVAHDSNEAFAFTKAHGVYVLKFGDGPSEQYSVDESLIYGG